MVAEDAPALGLAGAGDKSAPVQRSGPGFRIEVSALPAVRPYLLHTLLPLLEGGVSSRRCRRGAAPVILVSERGWVRGSALLCRRLILAPRI